MWPSATQHILSICELKLVQNLAKVPFLTSKIFSPKYSYGIKNRLWLNYENIKIWSSSMSYDQDKYYELILLA